MNYSNINVKRNHSIRTPWEKRRSSYFRASNTAKKVDTLRILSIDGGGIRGIIPATILWYLEEQLQKRTNNTNARLCDFFDFFAGTSTGGILVCNYLAPDPKNAKRPMLSARDSLDMYMEDGPLIFQKTLSSQLKSLNGLIRQRYDAYTLESCLQKAMGEHTMLGDLLRPCLIPAYDIQSNQAVIFKSHDVKQGRAKDYKAWQVSRATTAAPSYFEPMKLQDNDRSLSLIDGAMFARNPALCAYLEAQEVVSKPKDTERKVVMLSLGTGDCLDNLCHQSMKEKGAIGWLKPMIDIMLHSGADIVNTQLKQLFQSLNGNYHRINPCLGRADEAMDNVNRGNLLALHEAGLKYVEDNKTQLDRLISQLIG